MMHRFDVLGLGVATLDFIGVVGQEPTLGIKQPLAQWLEAGGGPAPTALVLLARLGLCVCMSGAVGDDIYGQRIIDDLQATGVATAGIQVRPGRSHVAFVLAEPGRDRRTIWWHNDRTVLDGVKLDSALVNSARALLIDTHLPGTALDIIPQVQANGGVVMLDAERFKESTMPLLQVCDVQIVSERFGREVTGAAEPVTSARILHEQYGKLVVVTAGERGSWCVTADDAFHTPAFQVPVVDTTGAGDIFHGGFLYGLLQGWALRKVARFASAAAALVCRQPGGRAGIPNLLEIETLLETGTTY